MSGTDAIALLRGERSGVATALTWVPAAALRALTFESGIERLGEALEAVATAFGVDMVFVPGEEPWAEEAVARLLDADIAAVWAVSGVVGRAGERLGWVEALRLSAADPAALAYVLDDALHHALVDVRAGVGAGAHAIVVADDLAGADGWLVSPDYALEALVPCYHQIASEVRAAGLPAIFHSDGDVRALYPAIARAGFSAVHVGGHGRLGVASVIAAARAAALVPIGGIEAAGLFAHGARHTGASAAALAVGGSIIISDDGGVTTAEDAAALGVALEAARKVLGTEEG